MKRKLFCLLTSLAVSLTLTLSVWAAGAVTVTTEADFLQAAADKAVTDITLAKDLDLSGAGSVDLTGKTVHLGGNTILANSGTLYFVGHNFTLQNGTIDGKGGGYALFLGDGDRSYSIVIDGITTKGGITALNADRVTLCDVYVNPKSYFALSVGEGSNITVDSGVYKSGTEGIISIGDNGKVTVAGGTFYTVDKPLAYGGHTGNPAIIGGSFDTDPTPWLQGNLGAIKDGDVYTVHTHQIRKVEAKEATYTAAGSIEHYYCPACNRTYSDEACTVLVNAEEVVIPALVKVEGDTAYVSDAAVQKAIDSAVSEAVIDLTVLPKCPASASVSTALLKDIAEKDFSLTLKTDGLTLVLSKTALYYIANQSGGAKQIVITSTVTGTDNLSTAHKEAAKNYKTVKALNIQVVCGEKMLDEFASGRMSVYCQLEKEGGISENAYHVVYLTESGQAVDCEAQVKDSDLVFDTQNGGVFLVTKGGAAADGEGDFSTLWMIVIIVVCLGAAMLALYRELYKKNAPKRIEK